MQQLINAVGEDKVGIKLSPSIPYNSILHHDPTAQFTKLIKDLDKLPLSYIHLMNAIFPLDKLPHYPKSVIDTFGKITRHTIIANGQYTRETGEAELDNGIADIISYGKLYLANPDLSKRFELNAELNQLDGSTMYGGGAKSYTDYPFLEAVNG